MSTFFGNLLIFIELYDVTYKETVFCSVITVLRPRRHCPVARQYEVCRLATQELITGVLEQ